MWLKRTVAREPEVDSSASHFSWSRFRSWAGRATGYARRRRGAGGWLSIGDALLQAMYKLTARAGVGVMFGELRAVARTVVLSTLTRFASLCLGKISCIPHSCTSESQSRAAACIVLMLGFACAQLSSITGHADP